MFLTAKKVQNIQTLYRLVLMWQMATINIM